MRLLDERVATLDEGGQLVKALNVLMLKVRPSECKRLIRCAHQAKCRAVFQVLENASRTATFTALLLLLRLSPPGMPRQDIERRSRFCDLVVKCLIKLTRTLGSSLQGLDVSEASHPPRCCDADLRETCTLKP